MMTEEQMDQFEYDMLMEDEEYTLEECEEYMRKAYMKELSEEAKLQALREIKEDLREIKDTLTKMQVYMKLLENK